MTFGQLKMVPIWVDLTRFRPIWGDFGGFGMILGDLGTQTKVSCAHRDKGPRA